MANAAGRAYSLTVLTPVLPGVTDALRSALAQMPTDAQSPFQQVRGTHFVRWVVIDQLVYEGPPQKRDVLHSAYLLFTVVFDGARDAYLDSVCRGLPSELDAVWSHCVGYPGARDGARCAAYLRHNQIDATFFYAAYPDATLAEVLDALELRARFSAFAIAAQALAPADRLAAFRASFPSLAGCH